MVEATADESDQAGGRRLRTERVKQLAREVGFDLVGVAPTHLPSAAERFAEALDAGYLDEMPWLAEGTEQRADATAVHPSCRSVVVLGVSYWTDSPGYLDQPPGPDEGWIARYAQGRDYHVHVRKLLVRLVRAFAADPLLGPYGSQDHRIFVDAGPLLEKAYASAAGLGWIGKHSLVIDRDAGSWFFLAVVLTPLDLASDSPAVDHCGSCTRCLDVCPTDALARPYVVDAGRCISTWTIEAADPTPLLDATRLGQHVFGCDLCQEVCPWNRRPLPTSQPPLAPRTENVRPRLDSLEGLSDDAFKARFPRSAVRRTDGTRMGAVVAAIRAHQVATGPE